jgi:hypothetical protein
MVDALRSFIRRPRAFVFGMIAGWHDLRGDIHRRDWIMLTRYDGPIGEPVRWSGAVVDGFDFVADMPLRWRSAWR